MADERLRTKRELKRLFTNLGRKGITDDMISILVDTLWRDRTNQRTSGFFHAGGYDAPFSFNIETRIFSIIPFDPLVVGFKPRYSIFTWANQAVQKRIYTPLEIEIPNEEGLFCVYFDKEPDPGTNHILFYKKNPTQNELEIIYTSKVLVSCFYWDATNNELIHSGDDRHGSEWNPQLHWYIHKTLGAQRKSGLQFAGYTLNGDGSFNDHARFNITGGVMLHDDFPLTIPGSATSIPVLYSFGTFPRFLANTGYAFAGASRVYFNSGQISLAQAASGNYVLYHIFATNEILNASRKIISVMGTAQYTTLANAYQGVEPELNGIVTYMPQQGRCYLGSIIIQTSDDYTNDKKARIVALTGNETHLPVSIASGSENYLSVNDKQELAINVGALPGGETPAYDWNIHGSQQIIGNITEPVNLIATIDGTGAVDSTIAAGTYVIAAINAAGETLPVDVPEMVILGDTSAVVVSWDVVEGATGYRVYEVSTGLYYDLMSNVWLYFTQTPASVGTLPTENTAIIYQNSVVIDNEDTIEITGAGIDVETEVDELDSTIKRILLKKQQSSWSETNEDSPNYIPGKPTIPAAQIQSDWTQADTESLDYIKNKPSIPEPTVNTDEKVKFDAADPTAGYLSNKIIAGTNITITEGTGADENKLKITATGSGGTREYIVYNEAELIAAWTDARLDTTRSAIIYIGAHIDLTANRSFLISDPSHQWIEFRAVSSQNININSFTFSINRVTCRDLGFRTNVQTYVTVDGHYANFFNCSWNDEAFYSASISSMKIAIKLKGTINSNTGKIQLENPKHISSTSYAINTGNIQPFIIQNTTSSWSGTNQQMYIEIQRFDSVLSFTRFSKVLLVSSAGNVPYKVTGDLTWFYHPNQQWAGTGNIHSSSELLKQGSIDDLRADFIPSDTIVQILGITSAGLVRKMSGVSATFTTVDGKTVTVVNGIITSVV